MGTQAKSAGALSKALGEEIQARLDERGISQNQLSIKSGISQPRVNRGLKGAVPIYVDELASYADALGETSSAIVRAAESRIAAPNTPVHLTKEYQAEAERKLAQLKKLGSFHETQFLAAAKHDDLDQED